MTAVLSLGVGVFGAFIGSFLNVVIFRVPRGKSVVAPASACPGCGHVIRWFDNLPVLSWIALRARCRDCGAPISARYPLVEIATALFLGVIAWRFAADVMGAVATLSLVGAVLQLLAFLYLGAISVALALIDVDVHRLPNAIVLPAYPVGIALLTATSAATGQWTSLLVALTVAVAFVLVYLVPALAVPGGMGMGDVKLAGVLGLFLGWLGVTSAIVGLLGGFLIGGLVGVMMILRGRGRKTQVAFGPWLLAGAWTGILFGDAVAEGYLGLFGLG